MEEAKKQPSKFGYLYKMAWGFEILASLTGLTVALTQLDIGNDFIQVLPITLAFALVAVAELTKIPLVTVALNANKIVWKLFFTAATVLLMIITFETMLNGLTNGAAYRVADITKLDEVLIENRAELRDSRASLTILEDSVVGGKIEVNLRKELEKTEEKLSAFQCETVTHSRTWYTAFLAKKSNIHVNQACDAQRKVQDALVSSIDFFLDLK